MGPVTAAAERSGTGLACVQLPASGLATSCCRRGGKSLFGGESEPLPRRAVPTPAEESAEEEDWSTFVAFSSATDGSRSFPIPPALNVVPPLRPRGGGHVSLGATDSRLDPAEPTPPTCVAGPPVSGQRWPRERL